MAEDFLHFGAVRMRINGEGNLNLSFRSLDDVDEEILYPLEMQPTTAKEPIVLANFISQRGMLRGYVNQINENFSINRLILFVRPIYTEFPN